MEHGRPTKRAGQGADAGYQVVHGWPILSDGESLGAVAGVGVDSHDNVFVFHRAGRRWGRSGALDTSPIGDSTVVVIDGRTGAIIRRWGSGQFALPHGLTVDREDNVWLTDCSLHQVYKFSHDGRVLLTLGERAVPGSDARHFNLPTDVAVAADGSFYVSDGYGNNRVLRFAPDGEFLSQWGTKGKGPGQFHLPHGVALDAAGRVYVADRGNARVQIFDPSGRYLNEWKGPDLGRPYGVGIGRDGTAFVVDGGDQPARPPDRSALVVLRPDGSLIERVGRFGSDDGQFMMGHALAVAADGAVYVGDITGRRVQKFVRR